MRSEIIQEIDRIRHERGNQISIEEIGEVVDRILGSLGGDLTAGDLKLYHEVQALAQYIEAAKLEIASIRPEDISATHVQVATDELDAIVQHTEEATGHILDAAENLENLAGTLPGEPAAKIQDAVTSIYEACNFQDITGQRITRVVRAIKDIESKVNAIVATFAEDSGIGSANALDGCGKPEIINGKVGDEALLNGPQLPDAAQSQEEIDALLASFK